MRRLRLSTWFGSITAAMMLFAVTLALHAGARSSADTAALRGMADLVRGLELSDLCLFTEASYTRHLSLADLRTPFQEYPLAIEHFPSGALVAPPPHLTESHARHD